MRTTLCGHDTESIGASQPSSARARRRVVRLRELRPRREPCRVAIVKTDRASSLVGSEHVVDHLERALKGLHGVGPVGVCWRLRSLRIVDLDWARPPAFRTLDRAANPDCDGDLVVGPECEEPQFSFGDDVHGGAVPPPLVSSTERGQRL
jgi:hypothetical protein